MDFRSGTFLRHDSVYRHFIRIIGERVVFIHWETVTVTQEKLGKIAWLRNLAMTHKAS